MLDRTQDPSGVSGLGLVAEGVAFTDGAVALRWGSEHRSMGLYSSIEDVEHIHGHGGTTRVRWLD